MLFWRLYYDIKTPKSATMYPSNPPHRHNIIIKKFTRKFMNRSPVWFPLMDALDTCILIPCINFHLLSVFYDRHKVSSYRCQTITDRASRNLSHAHIFVFQYHLSQNYTSLCHPPHPPKGRKCIVIYPPAPSSSSSIPFIRHKFDSKNRRLSPPQNGLYERALLTIPLTPPFSSFFISEVEWIIIIRQHFDETSAWPDWFMRWYLYIATEEEQGRRGRAMGREGEKKV